MIAFAQAVLVARKAEACHSLAGEPAAVQAEAVASAGAAASEAVAEYSHKQQGCKEHEAEVVAEVQPGVGPSQLYFLVNIGSKKVGMLSLHTRCL